jgi:hypothetical protein
LLSGRFFRDGEREYLSRVWLRDPNTPLDTAEPAQLGEWNGEYYASFGMIERYELIRRVLPAQAAELMTVGQWHRCTPKHRSLRHSRVAARRA